MQQEGWVLSLHTYIMGAVHHEMGIRSSQLIVSRCRLGLRRRFTKLEQRSWLKLKQAGAKQQKSYRGLEEACGTAALPYRTVAKVGSGLPL